MSGHFFLQPGAIPFPDHGVGVLRRIFSGSPRIKREGIPLLHRLCAALPGEGIKFRIVGVDRAGRRPELLYAPPVLFDMELREIVYKLNSIERDPAIYISAAAMFILRYSGQSVNLLAPLSMVRIHLPPPFLIFFAVRRGRFFYAYLFSIHLDKQVLERFFCVR